MANHKSAIKRHRQSLKKREANREKRSALATQMKKARTEIAAEGSETKEVLGAQKLLARAASKGLLHKRTAQRRISRIMSQSAAA